MTEAKILVVADDRFFSDTVHNAFQSEKMCRLTGVETAKSAEELLQQNHHDIVVCDADSAHNNGLELLDVINSVLTSKRPMFVLISENNTSLAVKEAIFRGVDAYLIKPFNEKTLRDRIMYLLGQREMDDTQREAGYLAVR